MWDSNLDKGSLDWVLNPVIRSVVRYKILRKPRKGQPVLSEAEQDLIAKRDQQFFIFGHFCLNIRTKKTYKDDMN